MIRFRCLIALVVTVGSAALLAQDRTPIPGMGGAQAPDSEDDAPY